MPREFKVYLDDILESISRIEIYTEKMSYDDFAKNELVTDGVIRNLEIIGEAVKKLPDDVKRKYPEVEWKKIAGLRDILSHQYFGVNLRIIWDVVINKNPHLKVSVKKIRDDIK